MQNAKYQLFWNDEMQNAKIFRVMFSSIQNAKFLPSLWPLEALLGFFCLLRLFWFFFAS